MNNWYKKLKKAPWSPPNYLFSIVWPILYILISISFIIVWKDEKCFPYCKGLTYFFIQLFLNLCWTTIFFKFKMKLLALLDLILILIFSIITFIYFLKINLLSSYLFLPYIIWLIYALTLNIYIVINNI